MGSAIVAVIAVAAVTGWHLRTRRHPCWSVSRDARFYITLGYPVVMVALFWLVEAVSATGWEWALGNLWAFVAMVLFVRGFNALHAACEEQQRAGAVIESLPESGDETMPAAGGNPAKPSESAP